MGSSRGKCEIVEANDRDLRPPVHKKGPNNYLQNDINKLFESVNLRATKSLDLTDSWRNASKKPMRTMGSLSPGIGFSEPVSLKQALRGLCISQAAEMAAMKRLKTPSASPRISEASPRAQQDFTRKPDIGSSSSSPSFSAKPNTKSVSQINQEKPDIGISLVQGEIKKKPSNQNPTALVIRDVESSRVQEEKRAKPNTKSVNQENQEKLDIGISLVEGEIKKKPLPNQNPAALVIRDVESSRVQEEKRNIVTSSKNPRRKSRLQNVTSSSAVKSNKDVKSTRSTSRAVIRNKNLVIKKPKKVDSNSETSHEANSGQICHKCQCSLRDNNTTNNDPPPTTSVKKTEKGDISQSSKSSNGDYFSSSTTTSLSDESNMSGSSFGSRPHMSKDVRWGAITSIRKKYGFLGLSHFNLLKKLGSGDIGTVYLAELVGTNCPFAIKVMDNEFLAERKKMTRAQTEREILRMLDHPFLPTLYAQFTSDNLSCLVMEFCPGGDLHVLRQKQPGRYFPEQSARFYVAEVLLALEYLHMLGIVYRDLKPENILVREDGHIMLTDFDLSLRCSVNPTLVKSPLSTTLTEPPRLSGPCAGSNCIDPFCAGPTCQMSCFSPKLFPAAAQARKLKAQAAAQARSLLLPQLVAEPTSARSNSFVGTHEYLAPEIIKGDGHGSAVDWWTFGVFLYELLYGKTPFRGSGNEETLANVVLRDLRFPEGPIVSFQARDLIRGLLVKEPENRLGYETGAAEIKRHPFFEGLNWALIRCGVPPEIPEVYDGESERRDSTEFESF